MKRVFWQGMLENALAEEKVLPHLERVLSGWRFTFECPQRQQREANQRLNLWQKPPFAISRSHGAYPGYLEIYLMIGRLLIKIRGTRAICYEEDELVFDTEDELEGVLTFRFVRERPLTREERLEYGEG